MKLALCLMFALMSVTPAISGDAPPAAAPPRAGAGSASGSWETRPSAGEQAARQTDQALQSADRVIDKVLENPAVNKTADIVLALLFLLAAFAASAALVSARVLVSCLLYVPALFLWLVALGGLTSGGWGWRLTAGIAIALPLMRVLRSLSPVNRDQAKKKTAGK